MSSRRVSARASLPLAFAVLAAAALPSSASAAIGLSGLVATPSSTAAGAHSDLRLRLGVTDPADHLRDLTIGLPPGLVGDPTAVPRCTIAQFTADACPAATQVGTVSTDVDVHVLPALPILPPLAPVAQTVPGSVYNLTPTGGEPARLGQILRPLAPIGQKIFLQAPITLRADDTGLDTTIRGIPNTSMGLDIDLKSIDLTLNGRVGGASFLRNPTSCGTATTRFRATSYAEHTATGTASFTPSNCAGLGFSPSLQMTLGAAGKTTTEGKSLALSTTVVPVDEQAGISSVAVTLPKGVAPDVAALARTCSPADLNANRCDADTIVGSAQATSPILFSSLSGPVRLITGAAGTLPGLAIDLNGPISLRLRAAVGISSDGRLTTTFGSIPDVPLSRFTLSFDAGTNGALVAAAGLCASTPSFTAQFNGHNGKSHTQNATATRAGTCAAAPAIPAPPATPPPAATPAPPAPAAPAPAAPAAAPAPPAAPAGPMPVYSSPLGGTGTSGSGSSGAGASGSGSGTSSGSGSSSATASASSRGIRATGTLSWRTSRTPMLRLTVNAPDSKIRGVSVGLPKSLRATRVGARLRSAGKDRSVRRGVRASSKYNVRVSNLGTKGVDAISLRLRPRRSGTIKAGARITVHLTITSARGRATRLTLHITAK